MEEPIEESEEEEEVEEEEDESDSLGKDDTEEEDHLDELARKKIKKIQIKVLLLTGKMAIIITGLFSAYLLFSYVQLRMKAAVSNMR